jgi:error-prone DNA polymerase
LISRSYYSLRYGTLSVEDLVAQAKGLGLPALVLTDINTSAGVFPFVKACREHGVRPVVGMEFRRENKWLYTGIARNLEGFRELNEYLSRHNLHQQPLPDSVPPGTFSQVYVVYPFDSRPVAELGENEYLGVGVADVNRLLFSDLRKRPEKLLAFQPGNYLDEEGLLLHRHLRAIDNNILLSQLQPMHGLGEGERLLGVDALREKYALVPQVWQHTEKLLEGCDFSFDFKSRKNLKHFTGTAYDDKLLLEKLAFDGLQKRYGPTHKEAKKRVAHELAIIEKLGFSAYFLIAWDVTRYSTSRGFYHVGRGSGANSVVAYCLRITDVDPIELDLYFERFLNPKRTSPPDFDIDYSWDERDEVLDYIFKRYGTKRTALMGAMSTFQQNAAVRELGKVYGLPKSEIDALVERPQDQRLQSDISRQISRFGLLLQDFPNVRSIHAGGVLLSEEPLCTYTALDLPPKGMPTSQWDMYTAEEIGFEKLDILSQRGIGHIKACVQLVQQNKGLKVDAHEVEKFKQDPQVKKQLASGDTIGCFYIESPGMRGLLKKLRCDNYLSLVAASSIIRPGVAKSGMMRAYIQRFHHPEQIRHLHPVMGEQLQETYGVMVYQEDVLKVCHHFAGLDLADADVLRRGMSGKFRSKSEFQKLVDKFMANCRARGYPEQVTQEVWRQVESFAGYSFSKAHSASFAVESYQSLFLKTHYPLEFIVAVINNFGGFYRAWVYVSEARKAGGTIHLPCVNHGQALTCLTGTDVYLGFGHVQSVEGKVVQTLVREREEHGPYASLEDFVGRTRITLDQLLLLIRIGALRFTGQGKKALLWEAHQLLGGKKSKEEGQPLFQVPQKELQLPLLSHSLLEDAYDELELLGFPVSCSAFEMLQTDFRGEALARELPGRVGQKLRLVGNLVCTKGVRTVRNEIMMFGTFLDPEGNFFDTVHFPPSLRLHPFKGLGVYLVLGKVVEEFGFPSLEVEKMAKLPYRKDPRY